MTTSPLGKLNRLLGRREMRKESMELDNDDVDRILRPDSVPLEEYEGTMVGMHISDRAEEPAGLPGALADRQRDSEHLPKAMLRMQASFLDQIGFTERHVEEVRAPNKEQQAASKTRRVLNSKWSKLALALFALCGLFAVAALVLFFEGLSVERSLTEQKLAAETMEDNTSKLKDELAVQVSAGKCAKFQQVFLNWLSAFCKLVNCSSELCHRFWTPYGGNCYYFSKSVLYWEQSRLKCIAQGAELLVIRNRKEQKFIAGYDVQKVYWIGLNETAERGLWKWVDGTDVQDELKFWDRVYPDKYFDYELEEFKNCGVIRNKAWANAVCNQANHWICKRRAEIPPISL